MVHMPNLSPSALIGMVRVTLMVLCGRRPAIGSFDTSPQGLWQAVASSVIFTVLVTIYPPRLRLDYSYRQLFFNLLALYCWFCV